MNDGLPVRPVRVILDTNVVMSALLWGGTPGILLDTTRRRRDVLLFTSATLVEELADVLGRPKFARRLAVIGTDAHALLDDFLSVADLVVPASTPTLIDADPDDDHVIAAAIAAQADLVVSGDRHLLALGRYEDIRIVDPAGAVQIVRAIPEA